MKIAKFFEVRFHLGVFTLNEIDLELLPLLPSTGMAAFATMISLKIIVAGGWWGGGGWIIITL